MSRIPFFLVILFVVIAGLMAWRFGKESYKILPVESPATALHEEKFETWHEFNAPSSNFKAKLPILPQHATERLTDPKTKNVRDYDMYVSEKENGTIFMISLITFLDKSSTYNPDMLLTNIMNDMVAANANNKLKYQKMGSYQGHRSLDFSIENDQATIDVNAFIVDSTLYLLTMISKAEHHNPEEFKYFINSFELKTKPAPAINPEATFPPQK